MILIQKYPIQEISWQKVSAFITKKKCYMEYWTIKRECVILGAFLLTPSHELSMERAALICEKMNFKGCFSLTKTATGILFKFSSPEDYQAVFKKGFHKVTGARFYRKVYQVCTNKLD